MRRRDRIALALSMAVLVVAPFAIGSASRWAVCVTAALALTAALAYMSSGRELTRLSPLGALLAIATTLTLLQIIPLPASLVEWLSPAKYQLVAGNAAALGQQAPSWLPLSLDPPATLVEWAKLCGYIAFTYTCLRLAARTGARRTLLATVALTGGAMALTALLHKLFNASEVYGFYAPEDAGGHVYLAPLLNANHLAALMVLSAPIALGLSLNASGRRRATWLGIAGLCVAVGLLVRSRGGAIALVLGLLAFGVLALMQRRSRRQERAPLRRSDAIAIGLTATCGLLFLGLITASGVTQELTATNMQDELERPNSKIAAWRSSAELYDDYPLTGVGRGAFQFAFTRYHDSRSWTFTHLENEYLQAVADWGFIGAGLLALSLLGLGVGAARRARSGLVEAGAFAGLLALAVENLADFSLWMPGIAFPAIAVAATLVYVPVTSRRSSVPRKWLFTRAAVALALVAAIALAASPLATDARTETRAVAKQLEGEHPDALALAKRSFDRHPADYQAAGLLARALFKDRDPLAVDVANRALTLNPNSGDSHRLIARMLWSSQRRGQALVEYSLALQMAPRKDLLDELLAAFPKETEAVRGLPMDPASAERWAIELRQRNRPGLALAFLVRFLELYPEHHGGLLATSELALTRGDYQLAERTASRAYDTAASVRACIALSAALTQRGRGSQAVSLLTEQLDRVSGPRTRSQRVQLLLALAAAQLHLESPASAKKSLMRAQDLAGSRKDAALVHRKMAEIEEKLGNKHRALWERKRAQELIGK